MKYAIIEDYSGYVWGVIEAETPVDACRKLDEEIGGEPRTYENIGSARWYGNGGCYHVHIAPDDYECENGGDDAKEIAMVEAMPLAARVKVSG